jgi:hypothetical protein
MDTLKSHCFLIFSIIIFTSSNVYSDSCISPDEDANREKNIHNLFAWAEIKYPNFFAPSHAPIQKFCPWTYVYYPITGTYIGVNDNNLVSVMGGTFGSQPSSIDTLDNLLSQMETESTTTESSSNPVLTKEEVLPYNLELSDESIARSATSGLPFLLFSNTSIANIGPPITPNMLKVIFPPNEGMINDILVSGYEISTCQSGISSFTHNLPTPPVRLDDEGVGNIVAGIFDFNLTATQCYLDGIGSASGYIDGQIEGSTEIIKDKHSIARTKYLHYVEPIPLDVEDLKKEIIYITGNRSSEWLHSGEKKENIEVHTQIPFDIYRNNSQAEFTLKNFVIKGKRIEGTTTIEEYSYNATWAITETNSGKQLVDYSAIVPVRDNKGKKTFPLGNYDLNVKVTSPLVYKSILPSKGTIRISLTSHNIEAEITYHPGYADVTYTRNGSMKVLAASLEYLN